MADTQAPNESRPGDHRQGTMSTTGRSGAVSEPNRSGADRRNGTMPLGGSTGAVNPPNSRAVPIGHSSSR